MQPYEGLSWGGFLNELVATVRGHSGILAQPTVAYPERVDEVVWNLTADSGPLLHVLGRRTAQRYESLRLIFQRGSLLLVADADTDEIVVHAEATVPASDGLTGVADDEVLSPLLGKVIEWAWTLTNNRGYTDAFQIRGLDPETREESCVQFEAAAATITATRVA